MYCTARIGVWARVRVRARAIRVFVLELGSMVMIRVLERDD